MQTSAPHLWQLAREPRFVLFWWWAGCTALSDLKVHVLNKMVSPFTASARTTRASPFCLSQSSRNFYSEQRSTRFIILDKMLWPFTTSAHTRCMPFLAPLSFVWWRRRHTFSYLFLSENNELSMSHAGQIDLRRQACTRVIYSRAGFGQRLLAWLLVNLHATTPFAQIGQDYCKIFLVRSTTSLRCSVGTHK